MLLQANQLSGQMLNGYVHVRIKQAKHTDVGLALAEMPQQNERLASKHTLITTWNKNHKTLSMSTGAEQERDMGLITRLFTSNPSAKS